MKEINKEGLKEVCENHGIEYLALFGSRARGDAKEGSDLDLLVRFNRPIGYVTLAKTENFLSGFFGHKVDLVTEGGISKYIKPYIQGDLRVLYGE